MLKEIDLTIKSQHFTLCYDKTVYWHEQKFLLVADVHAGKAMHFRKNGIPLSSDHMIKDLIRLEDSIKRLKPSKVIVLGDLFHSDFNLENQFVLKWICRQNTEFTLITGNHDIHSNSHKELEHINEFKLNGIRLVHDPLSQNESEEFTIAGHLHPSLRIVGKARQSLKFPCFYVGVNQLVLPAFGQLNGSKHIRLKRNERAVLITPAGLMDYSF